MYDFCTKLLFYYLKKFSQTFGIVVNVVNMLFNVSVKTYEIISACSVTI